MCLCMSADNPKLWHHELMGKYYIIIYSINLSSYNLTHTHTHPNRTHLHQQKVKKAHTHTINDDDKNKLCGKTK